MFSNPRKIEDFFEVVFENENFVAINKATNLSTQKNDSYSESVEKTLEEIGEPFSSLQRCGIVHRLDRNTTGLLIIAKNSFYQDKMMKIFRDKKIKKFYVSLNVGTVQVKTGIVKFFLKKSFPKSKNSKVRMNLGTFSDKLVEIKFEKIFEKNNFTFFKIEAFTGKTHQIRLAFESIGTPIYNDEIYGKSSSLSFKPEGHYLHAYSLDFFDGKERFKLSAELPIFFSKKVEEKLEHEIDLSSI